MTSDAQKIINAVVAQYPPNTFSFVDYTKQMQGQPPYNTHGGPKVLVFGTSKLWGVKFSAPWEFVYTYSLAQIMTKANAVSVLKAALDQFYIPQKKHPKNIIWQNLGNLDPAKPMTVDIETSGDLGSQTPEQVGIISICFYQNGRWAQWSGGIHVHDNACPPKCKRQVDDIVFTDSQKKILAMIELPIWHNGKFDIRVIEANTGVRMPIFFDTMLAHHVLNQGAGMHKLKNLCRQYLGAPEWEGNLSAWTVGGAYYENIPLAVLIEYNSWDVYWTWELYEYLFPQIMADDNAQKAYMLEAAASDFLLEVEQFGFAVDVPYLRTLLVDMTTDKIDLLAQLQKMVPPTNGKSFNPGSWQQVQQAITMLSGMAYTDSTDEKHLMKYYATLKGIRSTTANATTTFIDKLMEYRKVSKALSTYVEGALNAEVDGRVHTTFLIHGTSTGRLSSSGPNIQNIPREEKFRSIYIG